MVCVVEATVVMHRNSQKSLLSWEPWLLPCFLQLWRFLLWLFLHVLANACWTMLSRQFSTARWKLMVFYFSLRKRLCKYLLDIRSDVPEALWRIWVDQNVIPVRRSPVRREGGRSHISLKWHRVSLAGTRPSENQIKMQRKKKVKSAVLLVKKECSETLISGYEVGLKVSSMCCSSAAGALTGR